MPATLVFRRSGNGSLQQVQVGAADIVSTLAAAHTAWGWLGGLNSVHRFLSTVRNVMRRDPFGSLRINKMLIPSSTCHILTSRGMFLFQNEDGQSAFDGDPLMQTIGLTICALEHECGGEAAVGLFVRCMASELTEGPNSTDLSQALYQELIDHLPAIINEGASRNLQDVFLSAAADIPPATERWQLPLNVQDGTPKHPEHFELSLLGGMLLWLSMPGSDPYYTRSSLAARNAAYLKAIGYPIGPICVWDGQNSPPVPKPRGVVLIVGGSCDTDPESGSFTRVPIADANASLKFYFREETIGSMLVNALGVKVNLMPESVQEMFIYVQTCIAQTLSFNWEIRSKGSQKYRTPSEIVDRDGATLFCMCQIKESTRKAKPLASSLASVYFGTTADFVAPCYERIATASCVANVREEKLSELDLVESEDLAWFRVVTASIIYCIAGSLAQDGFKALLHVMKIRLCSHDWLESMTQRLNHTLRSGVPFYEAAIIVGVVHAGASTDLLELQTVERSSILGVRNGCYAVVPALFASMLPTADSIGIACFDKFIANVPVFPDSTIRGEDATDPSWSPPDRSPFDNSWQSLGDLIDVPADISLYIGIERAHHSNAPLTVMCARVRGSVAGTISIRRIMWNILKSLKASTSCNGHKTRQQVITLKASTWGVLGQERWERFRSELTKTHHLFLPALGDASWALYIAGSLLYNQVAISYGCFECAASTVESQTEPSVICGYGETSSPQKTLSAPQGMK